MYVSIKEYFNQHKQVSRPEKGFTIVELLIVVVVIAILAAIVIVAYNGINNRAKETVLKSDLKSAGQQLQLLYANNNIYPANLADVKTSPNNNLNYVYTANSFCVQGSRNDLPGRVFSVTNDGSVVEAACSVTATALQTITNANCSASRTLAYDVRDNRTYWVQQLADGKCWMLTNLAYAGGGTNTYSDAKTLLDGTADPARVVGQAKYYIPTNANPTINPTLPSLSVDGGATTPQYGYLYNWCAASGVQTSTSACAETATPLPSASISVCPAGWRLPTGNAGGELTLLNTAVNSGSTGTDAGLRSTWLAQRGGYWGDAFGDQGNGGYYWSSSQRDAWLGHGLIHFAGAAVPAGDGGKGVGYAVRCVAI